MSSRKGFGRGSKGLATNDSINKITLNHTLFEHERVDADFPRKVSWARKVTLPPVGK